MTRFISILSLFLVLACSPKVSKSSSEGSAVKGTSLKDNGFGKDGTFIGMRQPHDMEERLKHERLIDRSLKHIYKLLGREGHKKTKLFSPSSSPYYRLASEEVYSFDHSYQDWDITPIKRITICSTVAPHINKFDLYGEVQMVAIKFMSGREVFAGYPPKRVYDRRVERCYYLDFMQDEKIERIRFYDLEDRFSGLIIDTNRGRVIGGGGGYVDKPAMVLKGADVDVVGMYGTFSIYDIKTGFRTPWGKLISEERIVSLGFIKKTKVKIALRLNPGSPDSLVAHLENIESSMQAIKEQLHLCQQKNKTISSDTSTMNCKPTRVHCEAIYDLGVEIPYMMSATRYESADDCDYYLDILSSARVLRRNGDTNQCMGYASYLKGKSNNEKNFQDLKHNYELFLTDKDISCGGL